MKYLYCLIICIAGSYSLSAQETATDDSSKIIFSKVEIESSFPGGDEGWRKFLNSRLVYPDQALRKNVQGIVVVQFIVGTDGRLSDIKAISGPEELQQAAMDVFRKSPRWNAATINGKKVKSYRKQPIVFKLAG